MSTRIRLRSSWRPRVLDLCGNMGITRAALFRDLDSFGDELKETLTMALLLQRYLELACSASRSLTRTTTRGASCCTAPSVGPREPTAVEVDPAKIPRDSQSTLRLLC